MEELEKVFVFLFIFQIIISLIPITDGSADGSIFIDTVKKILAGNHSIVPKIDKISNIRIIKEIKDVIFADSENTRRIKTLKHIYKDMIGDLYRNYLKDDPKLSKIAKSMM